MEAELGGDVEGDVVGGGGHPDGVAVAAHLEVGLGVHRRVLRRLLRAARGRREQREGEEEGEDEVREPRHGRRRLSLRSERLLAWGGDRRWIGVKYTYNSRYMIGELCFDKFQFWTSLFCFLERE